MWYSNVSDAERFHRIDGVKFKTIPFLSRRQSDGRRSLQFFVIILRISLRFS